MQKSFCPKINRNCVREKCICFEEKDSVKVKTNKHSRKAKGIKEDYCNFFKKKVD